MKFSVIVPIYNVEKYLEKCLSSIKNQTYKNFEVIMVNDGSPDNCQKIMDKYQKEDKRFIGFKKENGGISDARNFGVNHVTGDYMLFIDSDDYIDKTLLEKISKVITKKKVDIIRFECATIDEKNNIINYSGEDNIGVKTDSIIENLIRRKIVDTLCLFCYNIEFWKKNNFQFVKGRIHEDFGLIPLILYNSKTISTIGESLYFYVTRKGSITHPNEYSKIKKGAYDMIELAKTINETLGDEQNSLKKKVILAFVNESLISKARQLNHEDKKEYFKLLKQMKINKNIYAYNLKKLIKKVIININYNLYLDLFCKNIT